MGKVEDEGFPKWLEEKKTALAAKDPSAAAQFEKLVTANKEFGIELFRGDLREKEFHRRLNETNTEKETMAGEKTRLAGAISQFQAEKTKWSTWYQQEKPKAEALVAEKARLEARIVDLEAGKAAGNNIDDDDDDKNYRVPAMNEELQTTIKQLQDDLLATKQRLETVDTNIPGFITDHAVAMDLARKEGFDIDPRALTDMALRNNIEPRQAYYQLTYEQREKKATSDREKEIKDAEERGRKNALNDRPSPDHLRPSGPSVVDRLSGKGDDYPTTRRDIVNSAVEEFRRIRDENPEAAL
jgi:hypothetical protein